MAGVSVTDSDSHDFRVDPKALLRFWFHPTKEAVRRVVQVCIAQQGHCGEAFSQSQKDNTGLM